MKKFKITEQRQLEFYAAIANMNREETLSYCTKLISEARAPNYTMIQQLKSMSKDRMVLSMNNFIMKGHGLGV